MQQMSHTVGNEQREKISMNNKTLFLIRFSNIFDTKFVSDENVKNLFATRKKIFT
jgi:hypothetical protein